MAEHVSAELAATAAVAVRTWPAVDVPELLAEAAAVAL